MTCVVGSHALPGTVYVVQGSTLCLRHAATRPATVTRSARIAAVVGSVLFVINQLDVVARGDVTTVVILKICLTYLVPFGVSLFSSLAAVRSPVRRSSGEPGLPVGVACHLHHRSGDPEH